ncbi:hypothetical protein A9P44_12235 [Paenibacillus polymyxa]|nr:DUF4179 domain-containing protein [Paenibacillus polymyxa]OBA06578.1 hypothetical protein A9P44_12235 [Paenibacillus polymyxa]
MNSREEKAMLSDADRMRREQQITDRAAQMQAIQRGLERGKRKRKFNMFVMSTAMLLTAVVVFTSVFLFPSLQKMPPLASPTIQHTDWGQLEQFKKIAAFDSESETIQSAIQRNYVQMVNKSAEKKGYKITVNAVMADENKLLFLYTATTGPHQDNYGVSSMRLMEVSTGRSLGSTSKAGGNGTGSNGNRVWYGRGSLELDRNLPFPEQVEVDFQIASVDTGKLKNVRYSDRLKVKIPLDPKFKAYKTQTLYPNQSFLLDGQKVTISQVELSPLMIRTKFTYDSPKKLDIKTRRAIDHKLLPEGILSQAKERTVMLYALSGRGTGAGYEYIFSSNVLDEPQSLVMRLYRKNHNGEFITVNIK